MKKTILSTMAVLTLAMAGMASTAQAGDIGGYAGAGAGIYRFSTSGPSVVNTNNAGAYGILGYDFGSNIATELRLATTQKKNTSNVVADPIYMKLDYAVSYLVKPYYELEGVNLYGLLGATSSRIAISGLGLKETVSKTGFSFGLGAEMNITDDAMIGVEWFRPLSNVKLGANNGNSKLSVDAFTLNSTYKF